MPLRQILPDELRMFSDEPDVEQRASRWGGAYL
jgi:hypothetical protein